MESNKKNPGIRNLCMLFTEKKVRQGNFIDQLLIKPPRLGDNTFCWVTYLVCQKQGTKRAKFQLPPPVPTPVLT